MSTAEGNDAEALSRTEFKPESTLRPPTRDRVPRKKACEQCSTAKVRCDLKRPHCTRCRSRRVECQYARRPTSPTSPSSLPSVREQGALPAHVTEETDHSSGGTLGAFDLLDSPSLFETTLPPLGLSAHRSRGPVQGHGGGQHNYKWTNEGLNFTDVDLVCTVDGNRVRNRWLQDLLPWPNQRPKNYSPGTVQFLSRVLKTYPYMMVESGKLPPIIHPAQLASSKIPKPLANCLTLTRMWEGQAQGGGGIVRDTVKREMERLFRERGTYNQMDLLAAFQSYLIYAMMAFFSSDNDESPVNRETMINLQEFACDITCTGLVCRGELSNARPDWESWIVASTKRRSLYTMYMFDSVFSSLEGLPSFIAEELESLPAPSSKALWEASRRNVWEREYNLHLSSWEFGGLTINELWPLPATGAEERRERVSRWLRSVDEFGMMMFAVTSITHGC